MRIKIKQTLKSVFSVFLALCMILTVLPETAFAEPTEESGGSPVIIGFSGYDCYGGEPYAEVPGNESLPEYMNVTMDNGECMDIPVNWELTSETSGNQEYQVVLLDGYRYLLDEALLKAISEGKAKLPWLLIEMPQESVTEASTTESKEESEKKIMETLESESAETPETESICETEESSAEGQYEVIVQDNISGIQLWVNGQASVTAEAGSTIHVTADPSNIGGNMYFNGIYGITSAEEKISLSYNEASGEYSFVMPDADVILRPAFGWLSVMAADNIGSQHSVTYYGEQYNQGLLRVGYFEIDGGTLAWCTQHSLAPPAVGTLLTTAEAWTDNSTWLSTMMRRIAYYGFNGPMAEMTKAALSLSNDDLWRYTSLAFSYAYGADDNYYGYGQQMVNWLSGLGDAANAPASLEVYRLDSGNNSVQDLVYWTYAPEQTLSLKKVSEVPVMTNGNSCYSLEGAEYGVFTEDACINQVGTLITDAGGNSNELTLSPGTYYVKELKASKGYDISKKVETVVLADAPVTVTVKESPLNDPASISLSKIDAETGGTVTQGAASLAGAQFTIKYYDGYYSEENLPVTATRTWIIETKQKKTSSGQDVYYARLQNEYKVSGDDFYIYNGAVTLPLGTITIEETKAPDGYTLENGYLQPSTGGEKVYGKYLSQVKKVGDIVKLDGGNEYTIADYAGRGGVSIQKVDSDTGHSNPQGNASLKGAIYAIYNENEAAVLINGKSYAKGQEILRLTTNEKGQASTTADLLPFGTYSIVEVDASTGYQVNSTKQTFKIQEADKVVELSTTLKEPIIRGGVKIQKRDAETGGTTAQGGATLEGAVFKIVNTSTNAVVVDGKSYVNGETVAKITTNKQGLAQTKADLLPYGTYKIVEERAPGGYLKKGTLERAFSITQNGVIVDLTGAGQSITDTVIRGGVKIQKRDVETGNTTAQGGATLEGAVFEIINMNSQAVVVDGKSYKNGEAVARITTNPQGVAQTKADLLPYGKYKLVEVEAPAGYLKEGVTEQTFSIIENGVVVDLTDKSHSITDQVIRGGVKIQKRDAETGNTTAQGGATLEGAVFKIVNTSTHAVIVDGKSYKNGETVAKITTNKQGLAQTKADLLPYGTYKIVEESAPGGYLKKGTLERAFSITQNGVIVDLTGADQSITDTVIRGGVKIQKRDAETGNTTAQGGATLEGAVFEIINMNSQAVVVDGKSYKNGETVIQMTTDSQGIAQTKADLLPYGKYKLVEVEAPAGYLKEGVTEQAFSITEDGVVVDLTDKEHSISDQVIRGGVKIQKRDIQSGDALAQGAATLEGAVFTITNMSANAVIVDGESYANGEVVARMTTNKDGLAQTAADLLPYGQYKITEVTPPKGYLGEGILERNFSITQNGVLVDMTGIDQSIQNQVIRGDFELTKIDSDTQNAMAGIPFKITSNTTGESHTFTTDANGFYSSSSDWNPHSQNTNGGGAEDGLWFGLDVDGSLVPVDDELGALPFDTYTLEELRCEANADKILYKGTLTISRDGYTVDMGNIENETVGIPGIVTSARDEMTGSAYGVAQAGAVIVDTVTYTGLTPRETYTIKGTLMNKATGEPVVDENGEPVAAQKTFECVLENGTVDVEFIFDASGLDGADVVVFEALYAKDEDEPLAVHEDLEDEGQTVHFPGIQTTAKDSATGTHIGAAKEMVTIIDTVAYTNLQPGRSYTLTGTLMDQETGKALEVDGREVTASTTFIPKESHGTVDVVFTFGGSTIAGKTVVVFETLTRGVFIYAEHKDIEDAGQTVRYPEIGTTAKDSVTGGHIGNAGAEEVTVIDTVTYTNLIPGKEYTVTGTLMDKATGKALSYGGKNFTATKTFVADEANGSVELEFKVPGAALVGKAVVAFESVSYEGVEVGTHTDIEDEAQTVYYPEIGTTAINPENGSHYAFAGPKVTIVDTVDYQALLPGKPYVMTGTLMDASTGKPLMWNDKAITVTKEFTPEKPDGSIEMAFEINASGLAGKAVVVFESLELEGQVVAEHKDIKDEGQTVRFPEIGTTARSESTGAPVSNAKGEVTIIDTVKYTNLEPGTEYTLQGVLMDKATGEALVIDGKEITAEKVFKPEKASGSVQVAFTFDASGLEGKSVVVFETLYAGTSILAEHKDLKDEGQTIHFPEIGTNAKDSVTGDHIGHAGAEEVTVIDTVTYKNLIPGKEYTVTGTLMDKATGKALTYEGKTFTTTKTFTADKADGSIELEFKVPGAALIGKVVVAFESVSYKGIEIGSHADIEDENQTVYYPQISTTAKDKASGTHQGYAGETVTIVDTVTYTNLLPGREYTVKGTLMDKDTGKPYEVDGKAVTAQKTWTPKEPNGSVEMVFTFDGTGLTGHTIVVFETVYDGGKEVAAHTEINDEGQTVTYPEIFIGTKATDKLTQSHQGFVRDNVVIVDEVIYKGVEAGQEYTVKGTLMDKATGKPYEVDGAAVTAQKTFTATAAEGMVSLEFAFNGAGLKDVTLVVFETLYYGGTEVAGHKDIDDEGQTVRYPQIRIQTEAKDKASGTHKAQASGKIIVVDTVSYTGLIPGKEYTMKGILMDKSTGKAFLADGKEVTSEMRFTPENSEGSVTLEFTFDGTKAGKKDLVVFETLYYDSLKLASHEDIDDGGQTVTIEEPKKPGKTIPKTGDHAPVLPLFGGAALSLAVIGGILFWKKKIRGKKQL